MLIDSIRKANSVFIIGNGGSYANAAHIANDLLACGVAAFTLDAATLTASANDFGYETVFSRWIEVVGRPNDLLIALSGSGKSPNILKAIEVAENMGMEVYKIFGAPTLGMQQAEELQIQIGHDIMCELRKR